MKAEVGKYKFGRHRNNWGIWQYDYVSETGSSARFIKDVFSYEEAVREVYRLNGWGEPKYIQRVFFIKCNSKSCRYGDNGGSKRDDSTSC